MTSRSNDRRRRFFSQNNTQCLSSVNLVTGNDESGWLSQKLILFKRMSLGLLRGWVFRLRKWENVEKFLKKGNFSKRLSLIRLMENGEEVSVILRELRNLLKLIAGSHLSPKWSCWKEIGGFWVKRVEWRIVRKENFPFSQEKVFLHFSLHKKGAKASSSV